MVESKEWAERRKAEKRPWTEDRIKYKQEGNFFFKTGSKKDKSENEALW